MVVVDLHVALARSDRVAPAGHLLDQTDGAFSPQRVSQEIGTRVPVDHSRPSHRDRRGRKEDADGDGSQEGEDRQSGRALHDE